LFINNIDSYRSSDTKLPFLSETSDYGSGTDPDQQSVSYQSTNKYSSSFTFDFDEPTIGYTSSDHQHCSYTSLPRHKSLSSGSSSSSSSSSSPSSSISNLSSLSSSSEFQRHFQHRHRLTTKKVFSINNNYTTNPVIICSCNKDNYTLRKRNRPITFNTLRRTNVMPYCENCQTKRTRLTQSRTKYSGNRQQRKQRFSSRYLDLSKQATHFTVDLTGLNIHFTVDYHENISSSYDYLCSSNDDWNSSYMFDSIDNQHDEFYYVNGNHPAWISPAILYDDYDFYFTKHNNDQLSSVSFARHHHHHHHHHHHRDRNRRPLDETNDSSRSSYYLRCMTPVIERECEMIPLFSFLQIYINL
jgi:hypothetical protein